MSTTTMRAAQDRAKSPLVYLRRSRIHGRGVFALRKIRKGTRILEYVGERISHDDAGDRYIETPSPNFVTYLFIVDKKTVIDGGVDGSIASYVNHGCDPNCAAYVEKGRVFIYALKTIEPGDELLYDYHLFTEGKRRRIWDIIYKCKCGAEGCRGTMLYFPKNDPRRKTAARAKNGAASKARSSNGGTRKATRARP